MIDLSNDLRSEISALQWSTLEMIKSQYHEFLTEYQHCNNIEILRAVIIYKMQERFYGIRLDPTIARQLEKAVEGDKLLHAPADDLRASRKKLTRNWKGKDYEVFIVDDTTVEYEGKKYKSLTAVAKAITGTHWNGPAFFGVKK